jgi:hypothetical protein
VTDVDVNLSLRNRIYTVSFLTKEECKILLPFFQKAYKSVKSKYEKYNDIHNGGEATEREENLLMKYSEQLERLESVLSSIDDILK